MTMRTFGPSVEEGGVRFRLWAPNADEVILLLGETEHPMTSQGEGWKEVFVEGGGPGDAYRFRANGTEVPDPASLCQETDVHGPSVVLDEDAYQWRHADWKGRRWEEAVIAEIHVGTATPEGTFLALIDKLDHYAELGVTALELMPVADFAGSRNWGYDGVLQYAPDRAYGHPDDLKRLIDEAHGRGLMVFLDVVYNHFGPDGNYLGVYAKDFFDEHTHTPWGAALNFGLKPVRNFFVQNAAMWLRDYRFDGLRFDAVQAISDMVEAEGRPHFLEDLALKLRGVAPDRHIHLILENDDSKAGLLVRRGEIPRYYDGQWDDDFHHVVHRLVTEETDGYYEDYPHTPRHLARVLAEGFAYQGEPSQHRHGERRGQPSAHLSPHAYICFVQNHDQVGNRAMGDRLDASAVCEDAVIAATALYMLCPQIPMLWMGEEWVASSHFPFFCDFHGELADAVREGRRREFGRFERFKDPKMREMIPDPNDEDTFLSAKLDWQELGRGIHARRLALFRELISLRHEYVVPFLKTGHVDGKADVHGSAVRAVWRTGGKILAIDVNLARTDADLPGGAEGETIFSHGDVADSRLGPWSILVRAS